MPRPSLSTRMARCAASALLAAVEIYNKPSFAHREQSFAILTANAWEILAKARVIQQNNERIQSIYRAKDRRNRYPRGDYEDILTIRIEQALSKASIPPNIYSNVAGIIKIRNSMVHLGVLKPQTSMQILSFGTASVQNFITLYANWFRETVSIPYLLPVGFTGEANFSSANAPKKQRELISELTELANSPADSDSVYSVSIQVSVRLNPIFSGGGTIGITDDPNAPRVQVSDDEWLQQFPKSHADILIACRDRYTDFRQTRRFYELMRVIKSNPMCAWERRFDPTNRSSQTKWFYNQEQVFRILDEEYTQRT